MHIIFLYICDIILTMKRIDLITSKNFLYRDSLAGLGYAITEYGFPVSPAVIGEIQRSHPVDVTVVEADAPGILTHADLYHAIGMRERVICFARGLTPDNKNFLLSCGIADVIGEHDDEKLVSVLQSFGGSSDASAGTFIILEHGSANRKVLKSIIGRFNYRVIFVSSVDELFEQSLDNGVQFVLINLGSAGLDLNGLVRKSYSRELAKTVPVLAYKDLREGLFVHELVGGLNRLTKYILSMEELYGLLVELLYRKEIIPLVASLRTLADYDVNACYDAESLGRAFFACEKTIFTQASLLTDEIFGAMHVIERRLHAATMKVESLKWLKFEIDRKSISTAGREG
jgi:hypothetical protein